MEEHLVIRFTWQEKIDHTFIDYNFIRDLVQSRSKLIQRLVSPPANPSSLCWKTLGMAGLDNLPQHKSSRYFLAPVEGNTGYVQIKIHMVRKKPRRLAVSPAMGQSYQGHRQCQKDDSDNCHHATFLYLSHLHRRQLCGTGYNLGFSFDTTLHGCPHL